jgi:hypothetical protein
MPKTKIQLIEEIRENVFENCQYDEEAITDSLVLCAYGDLDAMSLEEVQLIYNFEFSIDDVELVVKPKIVYVLTDYLSHMSIHATLESANKAVIDFNLDTSWITEMEIQS